MVSARAARTAEVGIVVRADDPATTPLPARSAAAIRAPKILQYLMFISLSGVVADSASQASPFSPQDTVL
jgi:hypothetical protein